MAFPFHRLCHKQFGEGFLFAIRETYDGPRWTVYFTASESVKNMLPNEEYWLPTTGEPDISERLLKRAYSRWRIPKKKKTVSSSVPVAVEAETETTLEDGDVELEALFDAAAD